MDYYTTDLNIFLNKSSDKQKLIVIYGPTGSWKTEMSIDIAKMLGSEIISTDSRQIYKGMDIGTGKITPEEMQWVKHHMIDIIDPSEEFSVGDFKSKAIPIIERLHNEWKIPMLVWGTGLYINSIIFDFELPQIPADKKLRAELSKLSNEHLYKKLQELDPEYAQELHPNNRPYIERAIEVKVLTGKSKTQFRQDKKLNYDVLFLSPEWPHPNPLLKGEGTSYRKWLYERINIRVGKMFEAGLEQEVINIIRKWYGETAPWMKSIGYQEFFPYFRWEIELSEVLEQIQQGSRNYAKRQLSWFSKYEKYKGEE